MVSPATVYDYHLADRSLEATGELRHLGDPLLLDAIKGAQIGRAGGDGWVFSRRSSRIDISPLYAALLGLHAAKSLSGEDELWESWLGEPDRSASIR